MRFNEQGRLERLTVIARLGGNEMGRVGPCRKGRTLAPLFYGEGSKKLGRIDSRGEGKESDGVHAVKIEVPKYKLGEAGGVHKTRTVICKIERLGTTGVNMVTAVR